MHEVCYIKNRRRSIFCIMQNILAIFGVLVPEEIK